MHEPAGHNGRATEAELPLRIIGKPSPDTRISTSQFQGPGYTVYLTLSRSVTSHEGRALGDRKVPGARVYGETMEITNTSVEEVGDRKDELQQLVHEMEIEGRVRQEDHERRLA
jgi:hypothetical protein